MVHELATAAAAAVAVASTPAHAHTAAARRSRGRPGRFRRHGWSLRRELQFCRHELDVPDHTARLAPELAGEHQRVEGSRDRHRPGHLVVGNRPDVLGFCQHVRARLKRGDAESTGRQVIITLQLAHGLPDPGEAAAAAMVECDDQRGHLRDDTIIDYSARVGASDIS